MKFVAKGFTIVELLVVVAIISILAAIVFPVIGSAKASASRAVCIGNMRQITTAISLYSDDYDQYFMPTSSQPSQNATSRSNRTWVQLVLPYVKSFAVFRCPADNSIRPRAESTFDQDLVLGDSDSRYYTASMHTNYGLNYQYLSPILSRAGTFTPAPKQQSAVKQPASTVLLTDSVWTRLDGQPYGGGNWLITPPCRYLQAATGPRRDSFNEYSPFSVEVFTSSYGWNVENESAANVHGNAWAWHNGNMNVAMVDGSVHSVQPSYLWQGCNLEDEWRGSITDVNLYVWDTL